MSNDTKHSGPVDVLAAWRVDSNGTDVIAWHRAGKQVIARCYVEYRDGEGKVNGCNQSKADAAANAQAIVAAHNHSAAVAELIEAAINVHAAVRAGKEPDLIALADCIDAVGGKATRKAALANVGSAS